MAFNIPDNQDEVINRARTDVQNALPESNPFFKNSFLGALIVSFSGRIYDFYLQLNILIKEMFPDTATGDFLERWGTYKDITRNPATQSSGSATATGVVSSSIPISSPLQDPNGNQFLTTASVIINNSVVNVTSLTRSGSTVSATTPDSHLFGSGISVTIAGAVETDYNGTFSITVTGDDAFSYEITTTPISPATGTITSSANIASIPVQSVAFGNDQNLPNGTNLTFSSPIAGVDDTAIVQFNGVEGGTDIEDDPDLRARIIDKYQNPIAHFSVSDIVAQAKEVSGVTRVFVIQSDEPYGEQLSISSLTLSGNVATAVTSVPNILENCMSITVSGAVEPEYNLSQERILVINTTTFAYVVQGTPVSPATGTIVADPVVGLGQVVVFFVRDNDDNIIPTPTEVTDVKNKLLEIKPVNTSDMDLIVLAPTPVNVAFIFSTLSPNTSTMQAAITANLQALFRDETAVGQDLKQFSYESIIFQTLDPETGEVVTDFTLTAPIGDVIIQTNEIPVLGSISYP